MIQKTNEIIDYSLIIPTFRRQDDLARCLESVRNLKIQFMEVIVIVRESDTDTINYLNEILQEFVPVAKPGVVAAIKLGIERASGEVLVFIDDDTEVNDQWLSSAVSHFQDFHVGAVGGRDFQPKNQKEGNIEQVGKFTRRGKLIGNHHLSNRGAHKVNFLKGCNMFLRRSLLEKVNPIFDYLQGDGAQWGNDLVLSITSNLSGFETIYDSKVQLTHHASPRPDHPRGQISRKMIDEENFNAWLVKLTFARKNYFWFVILYGILIGDTLTPGLVKSFHLHRQNLRLVHKDMIANLHAFKKTFFLAVRFRQPLNS